LLVSTSGLGNGALPDSVARASDFLLVHFNDTPVEEIPARVRAVLPYDKPVRKEAMLGLARIRR